MTRIALLILFALFGLSAQSRDIPFVRDIKLETPRMNGDDIVRLQMRLNTLGYDEVGEADGWYGPLSENAVMSFQADFFFEQDGIVTQGVWDLLFHDRALRLKSILGEVEEADARAADLDHAVEFAPYLESLGEQAGVYVSLWESEGRLLKADMRLVGDGSGYEYRVWFDSESLAQRLDSTWWVYDFESDEELRVSTERFYMSRDEWVAMNSGEDGEWVFDPDGGKDEEVRRILSWFGEALEQR